MTTSDVVLARVQEFWSPIRISAWIQVGAAVPLGILTATLYARQQRLGIRVPGPAIGLFGGLLWLVIVGFLLPTTRRAEQL